MIEFPDMSQFRSTEIIRMLRKCNLLFSLNCRFSISRIVSVFRRNRRLDISSETVIESGDEVIALSSGRDVRRVISELRQHEERIRRIMIAGNARLGVQLAGLLNGPEGRRGYTITILDEDVALCTSLEIGRAHV